MAELPARDPKSDTMEMLAPVAAGAAASSDQDAFETFDLAEALMVVSRYDVGAIHAVRDFKRGSRRAPKLLLKTDHGLVMLKRLAPGRDDPAHVASNHQVQRVLSEGGFPLPRLARSRGTGDTVVELNRRLYELYEVVKGVPFDLSPEHAFEAGRTLAQFHGLLDGHALQWQILGTSYHRHAAVEAHLAQLRVKLTPDLHQTIDHLSQSYARAGNEADEAGYETWPRVVVHGDWHPGNMLFGQGNVVAVFDYDTVQLQPRMNDIANGALQFSLMRSPGDPAGWPESPDEARLRMFIQGYDSVSRSLVSKAELAGLPWLMVEALIAEPIIQIGARGVFGTLDARPALVMVDRKVRWLVKHHDRVSRIVS